MNKEIQAPHGDKAVSVKGGEIAHCNALGCVGAGMVELKDALAKEKTGSGKGAAGILKDLPLDITECPKQPGGGGGKIETPKTDKTDVPNPRKHLNL